jgi:hypothetical protein
MKALPQFRAAQHGEWAGPPVAVLWDQSLLWGLICLESLQQLGVPCRLLSGREIAEGALEPYRVLIVPGGWASHKVFALGDAGKTQVRQFLEKGGSYLGFCGGAGLALSSPPSLGLVPLKRMPLSERLPNASGEIWIQGVPDHPIWEDLPLTIPVCIWWPSQFVMTTASESLCLATYAAPGADFMVADLAFSDLHEVSVPWKEWEGIYGINLDPAKLLGHPAIVEAQRGKGRLILSYPHLDTPGHAWGNRLFLSCLRYLDGLAGRHLHGRAATLESQAPPCLRPGAPALQLIREAKEAADALIAFGERHLLWNWRRPWLLSWRRGLRGLEYGTLAVVMTHLLDGMLELISDVECRMSDLEAPSLTRNGNSSTIELSGENTTGDDPWHATAQRIKKNVVSFSYHAKSLLLEEKLATQTRNLTKLGNVNVTVDRLRAELFGDKMNHGGLCRELFNQLDRVLLEVLRR